MLTAFDDRATAFIHQDECSMDHYNGDISTVLASFTDDTCKRNTSFNVAIFNAFSSWWRHDKEAFPHWWPLYGHRWNPRTKGQWCGVWWFLWSILDVNISFSVACLYPPFTSQSWTGFVSLSIVLIIPILKWWFQFEHAHHDVHLFDFVLFYGVVLLTLARFTEISTRFHPCFVTGMGMMLCHWSKPKWYWLI